MAKDDINVFMGAGTFFTGKLNFQGTVRIDGEFLGEIESDGVLLVGKDSKIEGTINVGEMSLSGNFAGDVIAKRNVTIHRDGILKGKIKTPALIVEDGAVLDGTIQMTKSAAEDQEIL